MRKPIIFLFLILALALTLAACGSLTPPTVAAPSKSTAAVEQTAPVQTQAEDSATTAAPASPTTAATPSTPECRVDTSSQSNLEQEKNFPNVGTTDWTQGPETAFVHILEYSDFQ
jgi:hypothetical protein